MRPDGRNANELRPVKITPGFLENPPGSCLIEMGRTRVICSVSVQESVPQWMKGSGRGWLTAEYGMLPGSSGTRIPRERFKLGGRTQEIQRLIGRSLRGCLDLARLGERSILVDCDVMDADGGTRTAAISGSWVALHLAAKRLKSEIPALADALSLDKGLAAVSVGVVAGVPRLDLCYEEDRDASVDMNIVMNGAGGFIEVQGTAESAPFSGEELQTMLELGRKGVGELIALQKGAVSA